MSATSAACRNHGRLRSSGLQEASLRCRGRSARQGSNLSGGAGCGPSGLSWPGGSGDRSSWTSLALFSFLFWGEAVCGERGCETTTGEKEAKGEADASDDESTCGGPTGRGSSADKSGVPLSICEGGPFNDMPRSRRGKRECGPAGAEVALRSGAAGSDRTRAASQRWSWSWPFLPLPFFPLPSPLDWPAAAPCLSLAR